MWTPRTAPDSPPARCFFPADSRPAAAISKGALAWLLLGALLLDPLAAARAAHAQEPPAAPPTAGGAAAQAAPGDELLILTIQANGIPRGEFTLLRRADGEFWLAAEDLPRLQLQPVAQARRQLGAQTWYAITALGATGLRYDEALLALSVDFPAEGFQGTQIDLSGRPATLADETPRNSLILSYRLSARHPGQAAAEYLAHSDANVRLGRLLLRQETQLRSARGRRGFVRGRTQLLYDDRARARRYIVGDVLSSAGPFGSTITGGGLLLQKLYDLTPDLITQPTATFRTATALPAEVEVAVDGTTISRTSVGPGPITVDNLLMTGGARTVRVTVTDASGRREVIEQPFLFTESALARGLHEYSYFVGRRSELGPDERWRYLEPAWQALHRYGASDRITLAAGGEGNRDFTNAGAGLTLRLDRLGLLSAELLGSRDHGRSRTALGWSARHTYVTPAGALVLGHRQFQPGFRTFSTGPALPFVRRETRIGFSTRLGGATIGADLVRSEDAREVRDSAILRLAASPAPGLSLGAEYQRLRVDGRPGWAASLFLRKELDDARWFGTTARAAPGLRGIDVETGRQISHGEGFGYRLGTSMVSGAGVDSAFTTLSANWNLRAAALEFFGTQPLRGGGARYSELALSGAVVAVDGSVGVTRHVNDSFVLARLGVPLEGVEISLNNQLQGTTDAQGRLFIPDVGAFGRQDVSLNDRQVPLQYNLAHRRRTVAPAYRSGTVVDFGGTRIRAVAGLAWRVGAGGRREPIASRGWTMRGPGGALRIETTSAGDFYLENAAAGRYAGTIEIEGRPHACGMEVPDFAEAVHELKEGIVCE